MRTKLCVGNSLNLARLIITCRMYLGHIIDLTYCDDYDINRELKCLFARANVLFATFLSLLVTS